MENYKEQGFTLESGCRVKYSLCDRVHIVQCVCSVFFHCVLMQVCFCYCPQSFSGGGLYLKVNWLLWSVYDGLLLNVKNGLLLNVKNGLPVSKGLL